MIGSFTVEGYRELTYWIDPAWWGRASLAVGIFLLRAGGGRSSRGLPPTTPGRAGALAQWVRRVGEETSWAAGSVRMSSSASTGLTDFAESSADGTRDLIASPASVVPPATWHRRAHIRDFSLL